MGVVRIPTGYFLKMAKADYQNYRSALAREFYQNSIDAGATRIDVTVNNDERSVVVADNGCGMTREVILEKLLVLGGTHKATGSVGAFGKAKELLFFSWASYEIKTGNLRVEGSGAEYEISEVPGVTQGTIAKITFDEETFLSKWDFHFRVVASKMLTQVRIFINGDEAPNPKMRGQSKISNAWLTVYQNKAHESDYASVRVDGIWMFDEYVGSGKGTLSFEIARSAMEEALTSNRDGLKFSHRQELDKITADLIVNPKSGMDRQKTITYEHIEGTGQVRLEAATAPMVAKALECFDSEMALGQKQSILLQALEADGFQSDDLASMRLQEMSDITELNSQLQLIGYKPNFVLKYQGAAGPAHSFMETNKAHVLANLWTEVVKQVLLDNVVYESFTAGFTFYKKDEAERWKRGDVISYLVNPLNLLHVHGLDNAPLSNRTMLLKDLRSRACHEIAHHFVEGHGEDFTNTFHVVEAKTWKSETLYRRIQTLK